MNKKWKIDILGNYCTLENGLKIKNEKLHYLDVKYLREQSNPKFKMNGNKVFKNDLLILVDGENSGELFQASEDGYMGSTFKKVIVKDINHNFLKNIIIQNKEFYKKTKTCSAIPHLNKHLFKNTKFLCPPLEEQEKIANLLSSLDNKIELNNQINKDLEEIAQTLYAKWFINFDFPNEKGNPYKSSGGVMIDSELGKIPVGWSVDKLGNRVKVSTGKKDANYATDDGKYNFFTCSKEPIKAPDYSFDTKAILLAGNGEFWLRWFEGKFEAYQRTYIIEPNANTEFEYIFFNLQSNIKKITQQSTGSIIKYLKLGMITDNKLIIPNKEIIQEFHNQINLILTKVRLLEEENQQLKETRDLLLPYLMTGKISVDNV